MAVTSEKVASVGTLLNVTTSNVARQPHSPPQSMLVSPVSNWSLLQWVARHVSPVRPTFLPLPATHAAPLTHWSLASHTPSALAHGHSVVHVRPLALLHAGGLSTHTTSLVAEPGMVCVWLDVHAVQRLHEAAFRTLLNVPSAQGLQARSAVSLGRVATNVPAAHSDKGAQTRSLWGFGARRSNSSPAQIVSLRHDAPSSYSSSAQLEGPS